jgi:uncharacterized transporter YbjL
MTDKQDIVAIAMAVCIAAYIALAVDYVAHHDLGVPNALIRGAATGTAILVASLLAIDHFGKKLRRARQKTERDRLDRQ